MFSKHFYVQVRENEFLIRRVDDGHTSQGTARADFSHPRTLVGNFTQAQACLKRLVAEVRGGGLVLSTAVLIHPLEKIEGGLSQVEERVMLELARGAGASKVVLWLGEPLTDAEVQARLSGQN